MPHWTLTQITKEIQLNLLLKLGEAKELEKKTNYDPDYKSFQDIVFLFEGYKSTEPNNILILLPVENDPKKSTNKHGI